MTRLRTFFAVCLLVAATPAFAHPGHDSGGGFLAGLIHPLTGVDHLAAMVMIGLLLDGLPAPVLPPGNKLATRRSH